MKPKFVDVERGSGKKVLEALGKIFKIMEDAGSAELGQDYDEYRTLYKEAFNSVMNQLEIIDKEIQEGAEWELERE